MEKNNFAQEGPDYTHELRLCKQFGGPVAGVDEAGRGPWAGPVVAAAVILNPEDVPSGLNDSKKLSETARDNLFDEINARAIVGVGIGEVARIDRMNILQATLWTMGEAVKNMGSDAAAALIDGNRLPQLPCPCECLLKGDGRSVSIAAASIVAKVTRDRIMTALAEAHPGYGWERNKGYGTAEHRAALQKLGPTKIHRRSFKPVQALLP